MGRSERSRERAAKNLGVIGGIFDVVRVIFLAIRDGIRERRARRGKPKRD